MVCTHWDGHGHADCLMLPIRAIGSVLERAFGMWHCDLSRGIAGGACLGASGRGFVLSSAVSPASVPSLRLIFLGS